MDGRFEVGVDFRSSMHVGAMWCGSLATLHTTCLIRADEPVALHYYGLPGVEKLGSRFNLVRYL